MMESQQIRRSVFTVKEKYYLAPHYIRVVLQMSDEQVALFTGVRAGHHNKLRIPADHLLQSDPGGVPEWEHDACTRTYTTRHIDLTRKEIWVDFVAHGDNGPAARWAQKAKKGDLLGLAMKAPKRPLFPDADTYLLIGDSTALPVIGAMLEQLPPGVRVHVIAEVYGPEDAINLQTAAQLAIQWLYNPYPGKGSQIAAAVAAADLPLAQERRFAFIAAEYATVKELRHYFGVIQGWQRHEYTATSYWQSGASEDLSASLRREERS